MQKDLYSDSFFPVNIYVELPELLLWRKKKKVKYMQSLKWERFSSQNNLGKQCTSGGVTIPLSMLDVAGPPLSSHLSTMVSAWPCPQGAALPPLQACLLLIVGQDFKKNWPQGTLLVTLGFILLASILSPKALPVSHLHTAAYPVCLSPLMPRGCCWRPQQRLSRRLAIWHLVSL